MKRAKGLLCCGVVETDKAQTTPGGKVVQPDTTGGVPFERRFRCEEYEKAVKAITYQEFRGLSKSTINAILVEHNHCYTLARPALIALSSKSWRFAISSIFLRRKPLSLEAEQHLSVVWQSAENGSVTPSIEPTRSPELDRELTSSLIEPLLNDCECCFTSATRKDLSTCSEGHIICHQCVRDAVTEAAFGQGWSRNIDEQSDSVALRCIAAATSKDNCHGTIPQESIRRALIKEKGGEDILRKLDERLAESNLLKTNLPLMHCPFCSYAKADEIHLPESKGSMWRRMHQPKFTCQNPRCRRASCISCSNAWTHPHICPEPSSRDLRAQVELAMSLAIKRTCPKCNRSFVKSGSGCNNVSCVCGYQMCYVCRKGILGYGHFCPHWVVKGRCTKCTKCELFGRENDDIVIKKAKEETEKAWMEKEAATLSKDDKNVRKELVERYKSGENSQLGNMKAPKR